MAQLNKWQKQNKRTLDRLEKQFEKELIRNYQVALKEIRLKLAIVDEKHGLDWITLQKYNRLTKLEKEISQEIAKLTGRNAQTLLKNNRLLYEESYYRTAWALSSEVNADLRYTPLDKKEVELAIQNPLDRVGMLQRNRDNQYMLTRQLREQLTQGIIQGKSYRNVAKRIKERMDVGASKALTIARTENHRIRQVSKQNAREKAQESGLILKKQWVSSHGDRTREAHEEADGQMVDIDQAFDVDGEELMYPGDPAGSPENVINCRCDVLDVPEGFVPNAKAVTGVKSGNYTDFKNNLK